MFDITSISLLHDQLLQEEDLNMMKAIFLIALLISVGEYQG